MTTPLQSVRYLRSCAFICGSLACLWLALPGCADKKQPPSTQPVSMEQRQDALLQDPMGYKDDAPPPDISGGSLGHYDKAGMKRDLDHVFNP